VSPAATTYVASAAGVGVALGVGIVGVEGVEVKVRVENKKGVGGEVASHDGARSRARASPIRRTRTASSRTSTRTHRFCLGTAAL
jgi:hypothetical protein